MRGIDSSSWQRGLSSLPVDFAILKISEGKTWSDPWFNEFYDLAQAAGVPVGAYVYSHATTPTAAAEEAEKALWLLNGRALPLGVYMDVEESTQFALADEDLARVVAAFCDKIRAAGYRVGIYGSTGTLWSKISPSQFGDALIWAASWGARPRFACDVWQYTDNETIVGYDGPVDGDEAMSERFEALVNGKPAPKDEENVGTYPTLEYGDGKANGRDKHVKLMQFLLDLHGCSCVWIDGEFGPKTEGALVLFKSKKGLTGETCDAPAWAALLEV